MSLAPSAPLRRSALGCPPGQLLLRLRGSDGAATVVRLASAKCSIGSSPGCTLRLRGPGIGPMHCLILRGSGATVVRRWDARTRLDGAAFDVAELRAGNRLSLGPVEIEVLDLAYRPDAGSPPAAPGVGAPGQSPSTAAGSEPPPDETLRELDEARRQLGEVGRQLEEARRQLDEMRGQLDVASRRLDEARRESAALAEQVETYRRQADARRDEDDQRQRQWKQRQREADQREQSLENDRQALEAERATLERQRAELDDRRRVMDDRQRELDDARRELDQRRARLDAEREAWLAQRREAEQRDASAQAHREPDEAQRADAMEQVRRRQAELDALAEQLQRRAAELDERAASLESRRAELDTETTALDARRAELRESTATLEGRQAELAAQAAELEARSVELDARRNELDTRAAELEAKTAQLEAKSAELDAATGAVAQDRPIRGTTGAPDTETEARRSDSPVDLAALFERIGVRPPTADEDEGEGETAASGSRGRPAGRGDARSNLPAPSGRASAAEPTASNHPGDTDRGDADEQHEESINDYMARLMDRVRSMAGGSRASVATRSESPVAGCPAESSREATESDESRWLSRGRTARRASAAQREGEARPRTVAPEKLAGLGAMRELANLSAQAAISTHARKKMVAVRRAKAAVAAVGLAAGVFLLHHWRLHPEHALAFYAGLVGCLIALVWSVQYAILAGHLYLDRRGRLGLKRCPTGPSHPDEPPMAESTGEPPAATNADSSPTTDLAACETAEPPRASGDPFGSLP